MGCTFFFTSLLCNSCNFQYFIFGWPALVLGPSYKRGTSVHKVNSDGSSTENTSLTDRETARKLAPSADSSHLLPVVEEELGLGEGAHRQTAGVTRRAVAWQEGGSRAD